MTRRHIATFTFACTVLVLTIPGSLWAAQAALAAPATLTIVGDGGKSISLAPADLKGLPRTRVEVKAEDGTTNVYEGVLVGEVLKRAGAPLGAELRGNAVASYVVASASDGYQVVFSLAELDPPSRPTTSSWPIRLTASLCLATKVPSGSSLRKTCAARARSGCCNASKW